MSNKLIKPNLSGALIVSYDFSNGKDKAILLVGKKKPGKDVEVINAFQGKEAEDMKKALRSTRKNKEIFRIVDAYLG